MYCHEYALWLSIKVSHNIVMLHVVYKQSYNIGATHSNKVM